MTAAKRNFTAWAGSIFEVAVRWTQDGTPVDLSAATGALVITARSQSGTALLTQPATTDADGHVSVGVDPDDLPERGQYAYRLQVTLDGETDPRYLLVGALAVKDARDV